MDCEKTYLCKNCDWRGSTNDLIYEKVETCMGCDEIESCPKCGSFELISSLE
jgi:hypothetical protein